MWFRIASRIDVDHWSDSDEWRARCNPRARWLSTNHLVGAGYWVWLIPLASGSHSVGIVADPALHPLDAINTFDKAMDWFATYQPRLYDALDGQRHLLQDFALLSQVLVRLQAGVLGPALGADRRGRPVSRPVLFAGQRLHRDRQHLHHRPDRARPRRPFGRRARSCTTRSTTRSTRARWRCTRTNIRCSATPRCCRSRCIWDYTYYWGVLSQIFFHGRLCDLALLGGLKRRTDALPEAQYRDAGLLADWSAVSDKPNRAVMLDQAALPWFAELNASLNDQLDDAGLPGAPSCVGGAAAPAGRRDPAARAGVRPGDRRCCVARGDRADAIDWRPHESLQPPMLFDAAPLAV